MSFEQTILIKTVAAPALLAALSAVIAYFAAARQADRICVAVVAIGWWVSIAVAMAARQGWQWWPEDAWRQSIWALLGWCIWSACRCTGVRTGGGEPVVELAGPPDSGVSCVTSACRSLEWVFAGLLAGVTAMLAMPSGEGWDDALPWHRSWMMAIMASTLLSVWSINRVSEGGGNRWSLLIPLAGLGGPMALAAVTYASLSEWTLAIIAATVVMSVAGIASPRVPAWILAAPVAAASASLTASARFYSYEDYPAWLFALILFGPTGVALVDAMIANRAATVRVTVAAILSVTMSAIVVARIVL